MSGIYVVIGHRGTGKTSWVQKVCNDFKKQGRPVLSLDTDQQIEEHTKEKISSLFKKGEGSFRKIEQEVFNQCIQISKKFNGMSFISLGAGYSGTIPSFCTVIHLKRWSDSSGRIFLDRPRLLPHQDAWSESQDLYSKRETFYRKKRDWVWTRQEGFQELEDGDFIFFGEKPLPFKNGVLTLREKDFLNEDQWNKFLDHKLKMGFKYFELKNDENSVLFVEKVLKKIPIKNILFSFRKKEDSEWIPYLKDKISSHPQEITIDWPLEWKKDFPVQNTLHSIYSLHDRNKGESLEHLLNDLPKKKNVHIKLAVEIFSFKELWLGHLWWKQDSKNRSFHPRSSDGRWRWYRILFGSHQFITFLREDIHQGVLDQPVIAEACQISNGFACILGDPIEHSITPSEQSSFFKQYGLSVLKILMKEEEVQSENIKILENLGMKFAALTSPLKNKMDLWAKEQGDSKIHLKNSFSISQLNWKALNTLILRDKKWKGFNTDIFGALNLRMWVENIMKHHQKDLSIAVWGGGGILYVLEQAFENPNLVKFIDKNNSRKSFSLSFYSARTGEIKKGKKENSPIVIWAVGRDRMSDCVYPPWKPLYILDLNYTQDSPAREYALKTQANYISGDIWFKAQAEWQRKFFKYFHCP